MLDALDIDNPRLAALFAADVQLGAVAFADDRCVERFRADRVRGDDRTALARCVLAMHPDPINGFDDVGQTVVTVSHDSGAVVAFDVKGDRIVAIGPLSPDARDRALPTFLGAPHYEPTEQVQATARKVGRSFSGVMKVCNRADGKVTTRRLARTSGLPALDKEVTTHFATIERVSPRRVRDVPIASCDVFEFSIHGKPPQVLVVKKRRVKELVQPVRVEKRDPSEDGVEGGDENGDVGGDVGGVVGGAPPPPPPPPPVETVMYSVVLNHVPL